MGIYLNPGNKSFKKIRNDIYVDKTGLIQAINETIDTPRKLTCFSRPRRFGKSFAAKMLCAYYDKSCDSRQLFEELEISQSASFETYLNKYDVIYLDITWFISTTPDIRYIVEDLQKCVIRELKEKFEDIFEAEERSLPRVLAQISGKTGNEFVIIIDEWDALFREVKDNEALQKEYIQLLRGLFKGGTATDESIAAAYMTGILPIKKYGTESALTDFQEYTMADPLIFSEYVGFTEAEVRVLCDRYALDFDTMKQWYDGYSFSGQNSVYNPNSVMSVVRFKKFKSYWTSSETYESLNDFISMDMDGLKDSLIAMFGDQRQHVETLFFQNDLTSLTNKNHVLTLLIHLGYLAFDQETHEVYIPNLEVAEAFKLAVQDAGWEKIGSALAESERLLAATIGGDSDAVANALEAIHSAKTSVLQYNDENSLACAVTIAYFTAERFYEIYRELPTGKGFADIAFMPRRNTDKPALLVELKYNRTAESAIKQIHDNRYDGKLKDYFGNLLLVGINYDRDIKKEGAKRHTCVIEKV
ncbi:MAG: ATP-binding protein [Clostridiales bacterium]|nr:ATP-binding protein [Clostridiales bacterium]